MDVKGSNALAALQTSMGQAHVDPEKGRQGDFEHWQRIFDATDRPAGGALQQPVDANNAKGSTQANSRSLQGHGPTRSGAGHQPSALQPVHTAQPGQASPDPALSGARSPSLAPSHVAGKLSMYLPTGSAMGGPSAASPAQAWASAQPGLPPTAGTGLPTPDGRPLAQLEAHLSRGADGRLNVALRSSQPLSTAQALHAVAQALAAQDGQAPVDQVLLNGQPIYRSAAPSTHRFEIDC